jgi:hypothetical protein
MRLGANDRCPARSECGGSTSGGRTVDGINAEFRLKNARTSMDNKLSIILWYEGLGLAVCARRGYKFFRLSYGN